MNTSRRDFFKILFGFTAMLWITKSQKNNRTVIKNGWILAESDF